MGTANLLFIVGIVVVVGGLVIWIAVISARARRMSSVSDARLDAQLQNIANNPPVAQSPYAQQTSTARSEPVIAAGGTQDAATIASPSSTKEERLAELAELHAKGVITDDELTTARAKILAE